MPAGRWWFLKELSLWQKKKMRFVKGRILRGFKKNALLSPAHSWVDHSNEHNVPDLSIKYILLCFLILTFHLSESFVALPDLPGRL